MKVKVKVKAPGSFAVLGTANVVTRHHIQKTSFFSSGLVVSNYSFLLGTLIYQTCSSYNRVVLDSKFIFSSDLKTGDNFTCICMEGFEGPNCNKPYCQEQPCQNEGTCDLTGVVSQMGHLASHRVVVSLIARQTSCLCL